VAVLVFLAAALVLAPACDREPDDRNASSAPPGVSENEILIGSSLALTGHAKYLGIQTLRGLRAYINYINDMGGVFGRKVRLIAYDDAYHPPRCLANTQRFLVQDQVFALSCYVGTPTTVKVLPLIRQAGIPLVGMFTGANALREPFMPNLVNVRASYYQETRSAVRHLVESLGLSRIAVFYQYDAYGFDGLTGTELALRQLGLTPVARGSYIRGTTDIQEGLDRIMASRAEAVVMIGTYEPCAGFIRQAREQGFDPVFYAVSFVGAEELARRVADQEGARVLMSQVVPPPHAFLGSGAFSVVDEYDVLLDHYFPGDTPNSVGLEGFINAKVLVEGLRRAGRNLTRESFLEGIDSIASYPLGRDLELSFGPADHQGLENVYFTRLSGRTFTLIRDFKGLGPEDLRNTGSASP
jgi:ABC-type branched-subunit amino acid transport system substrate-binding protein